MPAHLCIHSIHTPTNTQFRDDDKPKKFNNLHFYLLQMFVDPFRECLLLNGISFVCGEDDKIDVLITRTSSHGGVLNVNSK